VRRLLHLPAAAGEAGGKGVAGAAMQTLHSTITSRWLPSSSKPQGKGERNVPGAEGPLQQTQVERLVAAAGAAADLVSQTHRRQ
jgi:hypothetical protein